MFGKGFYFKTSVFILLISFYINSYVAIILAPGINPVIHFMDIVVLFLMFKYYLTKCNIYILLSFLFSFIAIFLNLNYGLMLYFSLIISLCFFFYENDDSIKNKSLYFTILGLLTVSGIMFYYYLAKLTKSENFIYMIFGYFNFGYSHILLLVVLLYVIFGYIIWLIFKNIKSEFKYLYIFVFIYSIQLLTYYIQSGLYNHLNMPITFIMLSLLFALYIYDKFYLSFKNKEKYICMIKKSTALCLSIILLFFMKVFYFGDFGKVKFLRIFKDHITYTWNMSRAGFITTTSAEPINNSVEVIKKYSKEDKGIYIISKFDVLLTLFADKYSKMSHFSLGPGLVTIKETDENINIIKNDMPEYLFVDNDFISGQFYDPYSIIFDSIFNQLERKARFSRYEEMRKIFLSVSDKYKLVEKDDLISVYKFKP
jgi:hypothetical protein